MPTPEPDGANNDLGEETQPKPKPKPITSANQCIYLPATLREQITYFREVVARDGGNAALSNILCNAWRAYYRQWHADHLDGPLPEPEVLPKTPRGPGRKFTVEGWKEIKGEAMRLAMARAKAAATEPERQPDAAAAQPERPVADENLPAWDSFKDEESPI